MANSSHKLRLRRASVFGPTSSINRHCRGVTGMLPAAEVQTSVRKCPPSGDDQPVLRSPAAISLFSLFRAAQRYQWRQVFWTRSQAELSIMACKAMVDRRLRSSNLALASARSRQFHSARTLTCASRRSRAAEPQSARSRCFTAHSCQKTRLKCRLFWSCTCRRRETPAALPGLWTTAAVGDPATSATMSTAGSAASAATGGKLPSMKLRSSFARSLALSLAQACHKLMTSAAKWLLEKTSALRSWAHAAKKFRPRRPNKRQYSSVPRRPRWPNCRQRFTVRRRR